MWLPPKVIVDGEIVCLRKGVFVGVSGEVCESEESDFGDGFVYVRFWSVCNFIPWTCTAHWQCVFTSPAFSKYAQTISILKWFDTFCISVDLPARKNTFVTFYLHVN